MKIESKRKITKKLPPKVKRSHRRVVKLNKVYKSFLVGKKELEVLKNINLCFYRGEMVIIFGPSGCGKSTLLHTMLGLENPDRGIVHLKDKEMTRMTEDGRAIWRRENVGIVFQQSNWVKSLSVLENVSYPLYLTSLSDKEITEKALECLSLMGMEKMGGKNPSELSGGEQQKVALARALVSDPQIIVADEPTGNLDSKSSSELMALLVNLNRRNRKTVIIVTHDAGFLSLATRRVMMEDGAIVGDEHDS